MENRLIELLNEYYEITKIMYSAIKARHLDIFETQVKIRAKYLDDISSEKKTKEIKERSQDIIKKINELESKIEKESLVFKKEIEKENSSAKLEFSAMKKSNEASKRYKYSGVSQQKSSYIDQKK